IDLVIVLDASTSVTETNFQLMKNFVKDFLQDADIDGGNVRVGVIIYSTEDYVQFHLNTYRTSADWCDTLYKRFTVVMFGVINGVSSESSEETIRRAIEAHDEGIHIFSIGVGIYTVGLNIGDATELDEISSKPLDEYKTVARSEEELDELPGIYKYRIERGFIDTKATSNSDSSPDSSSANKNCRTKGDVVFVLDSSGSVGEYNFGLVKNFTQETIKDLSVDSGLYRIGVITFSDSSRVQFQLNTYTTRQEIFDAIQKIPYVYGRTHTAEALRRVRTEMFTVRNGDRPDVPNLLVVVTDGQSNINHEQTLPEARQIKAAGATIVTVAIGLEKNYEIQGLTSPPLDENIVEVTDFDGLSRLSRLIVAPLCSDTNLCDRNPCRNEGVCVDGLRSYMCLCTPGFYGEICDKSCGPPADVVLILDSSTSIGSAQFSAIKGYAQTLVSEMNVETCNIHVGVIKYSSAAMIQFNLGVYDTEDEIIQGIQRISFTPARANMAEAIRVVRTQMFNNRNGDRPSARNIAFLLTDGSAEINRDITSSEIDLTIDAGVRLVPLGVSPRDRTEIEYIAESQGLRLMEIEENSDFTAMSDQVLEAVHDPQNHCSPNPCQNGGECVNAPLGFTCVCSNGFAEKNKCAENPCRNGGTCENGEKTFACRCPPGYAGIDCSRNSSVCAENPCRNGGTCVAGVGTFSCQCLQGYIGEFCEV
ncbi:unnamed protein product, partial [Candidula unifasciata]